jgi:hypothetical protein
MLDRFDDGKNECARADLVCKPRQGAGLVFLCVESICAIGRETQTVLAHGFCNLRCHQLNFIPTPTYSQSHDSAYAKQRLFLRHAVSAHLGFELL